MVPREWAGPSYLNWKLRKRFTDMPTSKSDGSISSVKVISSQECQTDKQNQPSHDSFPTLVNRHLRINSVFLDIFNFVFEHDFSPSIIQFSLEHHHRFHCPVPAASIQLSILSE